jgi:Domain of unknown function (DUF6883)
LEFPNRENAYVPLSKLKEYLLSETHSVGKSKAKLLRSFGFSEMNIDMLMRGLISIAHSGEVKEVLSSPHGVKYVIDGSLKTPAGGSIKMRTIWIIDKDQARPRFVTAYPV